MTDFDKICLEVGLNQGETSLYTSLLKQESASVLELSRQTSIPRTQVYRLLESLCSKGLVEKIIEPHRTRFKAEDPRKLETLINQRLDSVKTLKNKASEIISSLTLNQSIQPTSVKFYRGETGLAQMVWHVTQSRTGIVGYTYRDFSSVVGEIFAEDLYLEIVNKKIPMRDIISDSYVESLGGWENAKKPSLPHPQWPNLVKSRYLPQTVLNINHQMDIYNDTVSIYNWFEGEVFGLELINEKVASFHRQIFELLWTKALPLESCPPTA